MDELHQQPEGDMDVLELTLLIAALVGGVGVGVWAMVRSVIARMKSSGERRLAERYESDQVWRSDSSAMFFGLQSRGTTQVRGSGVLALTATELWFSRYMFRTDTVIPMADIIEVSLVRSHLRKIIIGRKLLRVRFHTETGEDTAAWLTEDPAGWKRDIEQWQRESAARAPTLEDGEGQPIR